MNFEKKHWAMLIAGLVVLFLVYWFFFRKKKAESAYGPMGGMLSHFGNETAFATPGSGYGLNMVPESGYGPMGGMKQYFGNETGFAGAGQPGSGHGLNVMESGFRSTGGNIEFGGGGLPVGLRIYKWVTASGTVYCTNSSQPGGQEVPCPGMSTAKTKKPTYTGQYWDGEKWVTEKK